MPRTITKNQKTPSLVSLVVSFFSLLCLARSLLLLLLLRERELCFGGGKWIKREKSFNFRDDDGEKRKPDLSLSLSFLSA